MFSDLDLNPALLKALAAQAFEEPTPVQSAVIPAARAGQDLLVSAETGTGKTAAFLLPILQRMLEHPATQGGTRVLILVPTRELAQQVYHQCNQLAAFCGVSAGLVIGGAGFTFQVATFRKNPEIIVATPGRLIEHIDKGIPELGDVEVLVLDEADRMLDMGFSDDVLRILSNCSGARQTLLFSATLHHRGLNRIARAGLRDPQVLSLNTVRDERPHIRQQVVLADNPGHKTELTAWLLSNEPASKVLVFSNSKVQADALGGYLREQGHKVGVLHSDFDQPTRRRTMDLLHRGAIRVLVATDVASRGIDVKGIDLVINFDMARNGDDYVHRIGRTGRAGNTGLAVSLIAAYEWNLMASIERYLDQQFERRTIAGLAARYQGPKRVKTSGKAVGSKKTKDKAKGKSAGAAKPAKQRLRDRKNIGKRRTPTTTAETPNGDGGLTPMKKRS